MYYYNQNDYSNIKYDRPNTSVVETVKSSGCGVCAACIVFNNLAGKELYTVSQMAKFSIDNGARDISGTNMLTLIKALCKKNTAFSYSTTNSETDLVNHLKKGGMAIANQGDAYNVFSTAGHYVVAYKMNGSNIEVLDPLMYDGKYDAYDRPNRIIKKTTDGCVVNTTQMGKATADRSPSYYLVTYAKPNETLPKYTLGKAYTLTGNRGVYANHNASVRKKVKELTADGKKHATSKIPTANAYLKSGTKVTVQETFNDTKLRKVWAKIPSGWITAYNNSTDWLK